MLFDNYIDINKKYSYTIVLTYKNKKPITILSSAFDRTLSPNIDAVWGFTFTIPFYIEDNITHQKVENPQYSLVQEELMVLVKCGDDLVSPDFQYRFIIKTITESTNKLTKTVECKSSEANLNKCLFTCSGIERELYNADTKDGILNLIEQDSNVNWKIGYVQPSVLLDNINGGTSIKVRWIDATSQPLLTFLHDTIQKAYNCLFMYDTVNKLINVYDLDSYGTHTGILLSEENYVKDFGKVTKGENICTRLVVSGKDGLQIDSVTLDGTSSVANYDYYINSGQMSDELVTALGQYNILLAQENTNFQNLLTQVNTLNTNLVDAQSQLSTLEETQKGQAGIQRAYIESGDNVNLPTATANLNATISLIASKQAEINSLNNQITDLKSQMATITNNIQKVNAKDVTTNQLIFNADLLDELSEFTLTENWSSENYTDPTSLKKAAEKVLENYSVPTVEFSMELVDLFSLPQMENYKSKIKMGDLVRAYSSKLKTNADFRIVSYDYNVDTNDLKINFSNKDKKLNDERTVGSAITKATTTTNLVNTKRLTWDSVKDTTNAVNTFLNNALDCSRQEVLSNNGNNRIDITENGVNITDVANTNNQIRILSGLIAITQDAWQSVQTAIDATGVYASAIFGSLIAGEKLFITNENGSVVINGTGITIKDENNTTVLSSKGVANSYTVWANDNVDSSHPLTIRFRIDDNVNVINQVLLNISYQAFRAYSSVTASGGSVTSSAGGDHRHKLFEYQPYGIVVDTNAQFTGADSIGGLGHNFTMRTDMTEDIYTASSSGTHTHTVPAHQHGIVYAINEDRVIGNTAVYVDGVLAVGGTISSDSILNLSSFVTVKGWHTITINADGLGRIAAAIYIKSYIGM